MPATETAPAPLPRRASTAKKTVAKPQDHKTSRARAKGETIRFMYAGEVYELAPDLLDNVELFEAVEDEKYITATRGFLGPKQWTEFKERFRNDEGRVPMESMEGLLQELFGALPGN